MTEPVEAIRADLTWLQRARQIQPKVRNFVDGHWKEPGGEQQSKFSSRDGRLLCSFGNGHPRDVDFAVSVARRAFQDGRWSGLSVQQRSEALFKLASLVEKHSDEFALLECLDVGKPISDTLNFDVPAAAAILRFNAEAVGKFPGKLYSADKLNLSYQLRRPIGVVAGVVGWNFPLVLAATKLAPALATGNSLILKPSELTSLSSARLAELAVEAGVPPGVFNVVNGGATIGGALALHPQVNLITFTGSTHTGKSLLMAAGQSNMKRLVLECGGKAPIIVFEDSPDLEAVADYIVSRAFWNQGQVCTASSRLLIQRSVKQKLMALLLEKTSAISPADPLLPQTAFGALVSESHKSKVTSYIEVGKSEGADLIYRCNTPDPVDKGAYLGPVVFDNVNPRHRIATEEIFGPILSVLSFDDEAEAVAIANHTIYGLSAIVWTRDLGRALRLSNALEVGSFTVNTTPKPTGGPADSILSVGGHKESGIGIEGGVDGLEAYMSQTAVQIFV